MAYNRAQAEAEAAAAAAAEAARQARIAALRGLISSLQNKLAGLIAKLNKYKVFLKNLLSLKNEVFNCSNNVDRTYEYAKEGIISKKITSKFEKIQGYSNTLKTNNGTTEVIIEDVKRKIGEIEAEIEAVKEQIAHAEAELASIGG